MAQLIDQILGFCYYANSWLLSPDYHVLKSAALLNKTWSAPAQALLYRRITVNVSKAFLRATHDPTLLAHVRSFALEIYTPHQLQMVFSLLPNLYEVVIGAFLFSIPEHELGEMASVIASTGVRIRALNLFGCSTQSPILFQLLSLLPHVEFLTIGVELMADAPTGWVMPCALYELKCHRMPTPTVLRHILGPSLRVLELRDPPSREAVAELLPYCGELKSLRLMRFNRHCSIMIAECTSLAEMVFFNIPMAFPVLPPSLEHLAIIIQTYAVAVNAAPMLAAVETLNLRLLTYVGDPLPQLEALCSRKHIAFSSTAQKFWINDDPIKADIFPRQRSTSNFYLMK
uniref:F-box domain-containing protein n=1 Tax=Mycena chlorophos TaxID=658473 RepID=A0ABQ0MAE6_MYCCL|nr:predicted protein [Mycena chlorophos]